jgi:caspase 7
MTQLTPIFFTDKVAQQDHSDNDCLLITIMTHGRREGKLFSSDSHFMVAELWQNFLGDSCKTLIGKPKLFFVQACRGTMADPGVLLKQKPAVQSLALRSDTVDSKAVKENFYVIPSLADILIMYSTAEGFYSFRNPTDGSWFIQVSFEEMFWVTNGHFLCF